MGQIPEKEQIKTDPQPIHHELEGYPKKANNNQKDNQKLTDDAYAQSLAKMAAIDYELDQKPKAEVKHFIPKKVVIYIVISLVLSIIMYLAGSLLLKDDSSTESSPDTTKKLLDSAKELRDIQNQ